jgi:serine/threonine-protein kinase RsbW
MGGEEYTLDGLAVPESLGLLHDLLEKVAEDHPGLSPNDLLLFETAVIEIAGNVVEHGRPPGEVRYTFTLAVLPDRLEAVLTDTGEEVPDPDGADLMPDGWDETGRGLPLARAALDELSYARGDDGNLWRMTKRSAAGPQEPGKSTGPDESAASRSATP